MRQCGGGTGRAGLETGSIWGKSGSEVSSEARPLSSNPGVSLFDLGQVSSALCDLACASVNRAVLQDKSCGPGAALRGSFSTR